ncbi:MAG: hypothetical protein MUF02_05085 [Acidobacteria bacterium]|jgi:hypothetical protein|nr:hypothetical protein [Acidobacteriota bacterium]
MERFIQAAADIDVDEIMAAIRGRIQDRKDAGLLKQSDIDEIAAMELQPLPDFQEIPHIYEPVLYPGFTENLAPPAALEEANQEKGLLKELMKRVRRLLAPWTRFMNRPMYLELKTNILDLQKKVPIVLQSSEYIRLLHNAMHNLIVEASKLKTEEEILKTRMRILEDKIEFLENRQRALEKNSPAP